MKLHLIALFLAVTTAAVLGEEEGLFVADHEIAPTQRFKDGEIIMAWKAERLKLTRAVFRYDTEDRDLYWLELDFTKLADPGDYYLFRIDGRDYNGFRIRGEGTNKGGGRWVLGFADPSAGRDLLTKVAKVYELKGDQVEDQTKGEQDAAPNP